MYNLGHLPKQYDVSTDVLKRYNFRAHWFGYNEENVT